MRTRLPAALLLLLFSIFLVGGGTPGAGLTAATHATSATVANEAIAQLREHSRPQQFLPGHTDPQLRGGFGAQAGHGGLAVVRVASPRRGLPQTTAAGSVRRDAPGRPSPVAGPARAPPLSTVR